MSFFIPNIEIKPVAFYDITTSNLRFGDYVISDSIFVIFVLDGHKPSLNSSFVLHKISSGIHICLCIFNEFCLENAIRNNTFSLYLFSSTYRIFNGIDK